MLAPMTMGQRGRVLAGRENQRRPEVFGLLFDRPVPAGRIHDAVNRVAAAHTGLRYHFPDRTGTVAEVAGTVDVPLLVDPARPTVDDAIRFRVAPEVHDFLLTPFDLATVPLLRVAVAGLDDGRTLAWFAVEHAVFDGGSVPVFLADLGNLVAGRGAPAGSDFAAFARHEADWLSSADGREAGRFWAGVWDRIGPFPPLGTGRPAPATAGPTSSRISPLDADALARTGTTTAGRRIPVLTRLAAAASVALTELGEDGESGAVVQFGRRGTDRTRAMIGYLNNRLLLPLTFRPDRTFGEVVAEVGESVRTAVRHGTMPFETMAGPGSGRPAVAPAPHLYLNAIPRLSPPSIEGLDVRLVWPEVPLVEARSQAVDVSRLALQTVELARDRPLLSVLHNPAVFDDRVVGYVESRVVHLLQDGG